MSSKSIAKTLGEKGLCVCPGFLSPSLVADSLADLSAIRALGRFQSAGVGQGAGRITSPQIRNDETYWLEREAANATQARMWRKIDLLRAAFNRTLFLGLRNFEGHYAVYSEGGFYERHRDSFRQDSARVVSFVLYLNSDWKPSDGGGLRIFKKQTSGAETYTDIDPVGGTMVCFLSRELEHEVLLSHRARFSLTGWFKV